MKKIKQFRLLLPVMAMAIAICASAFTKVPNKFAIVTSYFANETHLTGAPPSATLPTGYTDVTAIIAAITPPPGESKVQAYETAHCPTPTTPVCLAIYQVNTINHAVSLVSTFNGTFD